MNTIIIIPARFSSTRYPGKPLAKIKNREAILWTMEAAFNISNIDAIYIATDNEKIKSCVENNGGAVIMTSENCRNGTERVAEAASLLNLTDEDIIVNLQGDAPLTPHWFIEDLISSIKHDPEADMVTPALRCDPDSLYRFLNDRQNGRVGATTVVFDSNRRALYFSKEVIPYTSQSSQASEIPVFHHVGVYAYRKTALESYPKWDIGRLEKAEQLEQLRFIEQGKNVKIKIVKDYGHLFWELNNPEDVEIIEKMIDANKLLRQ